MLAPGGEMGQHGLWAWKPEPSWGLQAGALGGPAGPWRVPPSIGSAYKSACLVTWDPAHEGTTCPIS